MYLKQGHLNTSFFGRLQSKTSVQWLVMVGVLLIGMAVHVQAETLRILAWEGYTPDVQLQVYKQEVKRKFDVDLEIDVHYARQFSEFFDGLRGDKFDLVAPIYDIIKDANYDLIANKLIMPVDLANIPNYATLIPALQYPNYATEGGQVYAVAMVQGPYGLMYNKDRIAAPESWSVLWDPQYKGQYTIGNLPNFNVVTVALSLGLKGDSVFHYESLRSDPRVLARLTELVKNSRKVWDGVDDATDLKDLPLTAGYGFSIPALREMGQNWQYATPVEGSIWWVDNWVLSAQLANKPMLKRIAEDFINFTLSTRYQLDVFMRGTASFPVTLDVKPMASAQEVVFFHLDDPRYFSLDRPILKSLNPRDRNGMQLLWDSALRNAGRKAEPAGSGP
jgi:spermidine/putrescine transport system substrate-binding protein